MKNKEGKFRFKKFAMSHSRSSMKVGVDGVFVGAWATPTEGEILDVGCGCGLIALMLAQRTEKAEILAIDIDSPSIDEAAGNFLESIWSDRMKALNISFDEIRKKYAGDGKRFSLIVSNPPYFDSGVEVLDDARKLARHQGELSPEVLLNECGGILEPEGRLAMVVPAVFYSRLVEISVNTELKVSRVLFIKDHDGAKVKRVLLEFVKEVDEGKPLGQRSEPDIRELTMFVSPGEPTEEYRKLCKDFYLKF